MKEITNERKERYIDEACKRELGLLDESGVDKIEERIAFWQSQSDTDRFNATEEINRRVHLVRAAI